MKKFISAMLSLLMILTVFPLMTFAQEGEVGTEMIYVSVDEFYDSDELFAAYAEREFYPEYAISAWGISARKQLSSKSQKIYDAMKAQIESVASGKSNSTTFNFDETSLKTWGFDCSFTTAEVGDSKVTAKFATEIDISKVVDALFADCPYDMYWFDKKQQWAYGARATHEGNNYNVVGFMVVFPVVPKYQADSYDANDPQTNKSKTGATSVAVANAKAIVEKYKELDDYNKIVAYKNEINNLVVYDTDSANQGGYGDPWQLIYVFDNDSNTNVVCEGYSKAMQYLCENSEFASDKIACYSVSGTTHYNGSSGGHMWNIITMDDGKNYMVDVTNSDSGAVGQNGGLFLNGMSGSLGSGYVGKKVTYVYYPDTMDLWGSDSESILNLSSTDYIYNDPNPHVCAPNGNVWHNDEVNHWHSCICGEKLDVEKHIPSPWMTTKQPDVGIEGEKIKQCVVCEYILEKEAIPAKEPHVCEASTDWYSDEYSHWRLCGCGSLYDEYDHEPGEWEIVKPAQVGIEGKKEKRCKVCDYLLDEETIAALVHTCVIDGNGWYFDETSHWHECSCGEKMDTAIHHEGDWEIVKTAEIGIDGKKEKRCENCKYLLAEEIIPALEQPNPQPEIPIGLRGDVNGNGSVDSRDYVQVKRAYFKTAKLNEIAAKLADVNNNGSLDSRDYVTLKRVYFKTAIIKEEIKYVY